MHHVEVSPLLQALLVVLLAAPVLHVLYITGWRGRLGLVAFVLLCAVANPGRDRHVRAIGRAVPGSDARLLDGLVVYHNFVIVSAGSIGGRLVSLGGIGQLLVGSMSCATLKTISGKAPPPASKGSCAP
jgi:hypothetical protein